MGANAAYFKLYLHEQQKKDVFLALRQKKARE